ncbi:hypothetical protein QZH41_008972 [Actinostola sp. cb2023]|nr:hypothetical protein QZH41_008972 [Actinostola sp. cb2023]
MHHHYTIENSCQDEPCRNGGTCRPLTSGYQCNCTANNIGKRCGKWHGNSLQYELKIGNACLRPFMKWCTRTIYGAPSSSSSPNNITLNNVNSLYILEFLKVNTNPVCFSAKGNKYGVFYTANAGQIKSFKLVHVSGKVGPYPATSANWGTSGSRLDTIITDSLNKVLTPPIASLNGYYSYTLPGISGNDPELNLPGFSPSMSVVPRQQFRVWFGEDLRNTAESDNHGTSCVDVFAHYEP